jgi:hypothetical protein
MKLFLFDPRARRLVSCCALALASGCGGGGGGGGSSPSPVIPVAYSGKTSQAAIATGNAAQLAVDVLGAETSAGLGGVPLSAGAAPRVHGPISIARRLGGRLLDTLARKSSAKRRTPASIPVGDTSPCDGGGSVSVSGTLSDAGLGTLAVAFNACGSDGDVLSGPARMIVDAAVLGPDGPSPTDFTLSFDRLTLRGVSGSFDLGGSVRSQHPPASNETTTLNIVSLDNGSALTSKTENLVLVDVNDALGFGFTETVTGRVFDPVHGYVDVSTVEPLGFASDVQQFPNPGQLVLAGTSGKSIQVTALSDTKVMLELDLDADTKYESLATVAWNQLSATTVLSFTRPTAPQVTVSVNSDRSVAITWAASSDATGILEYRVRRGTMPIGRTSGTSFTDRSVEPGSTADYYVRAVANSGNVSDLAPPKSVKIPSSGTAVFGMPISATVPSSLIGVGIGVADVNGDGVRDLVLSVGDSTIQQIATALGPLPSGISITTSPTDFATMAGDSNLPFFHLADIVGSGLPEALGAGRTLAWSATGNTWVDAVGSNQSFQFEARAYIDLNDDGIPDIVSVETPGTVTPIMFGTLGNGDGSYDRSSKRSIGGIKNFTWTRIGAIVAADVDRDGLTDLIVWDDDKLRVVRQTERGKFAVTASLPAISNTGFRAVLLVADVTGDGYPEVIFASYQENPDQLRVYVNDGTGNFGTTAVASNVLSPWNFAAADIDGDGIPDLVAGNRQTTALDLYISQGDGTFTLKSSISGVGFPNIQLADVDLDGDLDIVIAGGVFQSPDVKLYLNQ